MKYFLILFLFFLPACKPTEELLSDQKLMLGENTTWELSSFEGVDFDASKIKITLVLAEDGRIDGQAPCNRYFTENSATLPNIKIKFPGIGSTKMGCSQLNLEYKYLTVLKGITFATIIDGKLLLKKDGKTLLTFK